MTVYDVTRELSGDAVVYPGDIIPEMKTEDNGQYVITDLHISTHSGTHIDAPLHYIRGGRTVDMIPPKRLFGPVQVLDLTGVSGEIKIKDLEGWVQGETGLFIKTDFSKKSRFEPGYTSLSTEAAEYLADSGLLCIGIDTPSIEAFDGNGDVHRTLLGKNIVIIELLDLTLVQEGSYFMAALPLRLKSLDGSPARVLLSDKSDMNMWEM